MFLDNLEQIVGYGKNVALLDEQLKLLSRRGRNVRLKLRGSFLAHDSERKSPDRVSGGRGEASRPKGGGGLLVGGSHADFGK